MECPSNVYGWLDISCIWLVIYINLYTIPTCSISPIKLVIWVAILSKLPHLRANP